jgi:hypothetical protein
VSAEGELLARLQRALADAEVDVGPLLDEAWQQARDEVRTTLRRLFTHELLRRSLDHLTDVEVDQRSDAEAVPPAPEPEPPASEQQRPPATPQQLDERATYLFGLVPTTAPVPDVPAPFPGAGPVRVVDVGEVRAVVCDVAPAAFRRLDDPGRDDLELLAATAFGHDDLLATLGRSGPVLPLRLGTVLRDDDALRGLLAAHGATLRDELHRLEGHAEWAVTVHLVEDASPDGDGREGGTTPASGRDYLQARKQDLERRATRRNVRSEIATLVHDRLAALAADAAVVGARPLEDGTPPLLHGVYLLADERRDGFDAAIDELRATHPDAAIEVSGPWPAYHFTDVALDAGDPAST